MKLFHPSKKHTSIALHCLGFCCAAILLIVALFHLSQIFSFLGNLLSAISPLAYGLVFAYLLRPLSRKFECLLSKKIRPLALARTFALICTYLCLAIVLFCVARFLIPALLGDAKLLGVSILDFIQDLSATISSFATSLGFDTSTITIDSLLRGYYDAIIGFITGVIQRFFFSTYKIILGLFLSAALLYHTETLIGGARRFVVSVCPASLCHFIHRVMVYSDKMFGKYIIGKIAETMIVCIIYITVLSIIKMPYAFLIAIIMTVTNLIPVLGAYIGGIPSALIVCTVDPKMLVWFLVVYLAIEQVNANIIAPRVLGSILGLRAVWIMLAVAFFGSLFGIWGMLLSAPLFSIIYALVRDAINARLARLGENTSTDHYTNMFASTAPRRRRFRRPHDTHTHSQDDNKQ